MAFMPGLTVQCTNPKCEDRGHWLRLEQLRDEQCPTCGGSLRSVPPPLPLRPHMRPRPLAPRPSHRPR